jgi:hypothetical protein
MFTRSTDPRIQLARWFFVHVPVIVALALTFASGRSAFAQAATTTSLTVTSGGSAVTSVSAGTVVTLTATVVAGTTPVTPGQVEFCDASVSYCTDIHLLALAQLTTNGTAVIKFRPGGGSRSYKAVFVGTNTYAGSSSSASSLSVTAPFPSVTQIQESYQNDSWNLTALVSGGLSTPSLTAPTGAVSFVDTSNGNAVLGTANLSGSAISNGFSYTNSLPSYYPEPSSFGSAVTADFNGDGIPDMVAIEYTDQNTLDFYAGNGDGTFTLSHSVTSFPTDSFPSIWVADFNGDGIPDLAFGNSNGSLEIYLGNGDGTFTAKSTFTPQAGNTPAAAIGDFNNDGIPDFVALNGSGSLTLWIGKGDGTFTASTATVSAPITPGTIQTADFNGDGIPDLLLQDGTNLSVLLGKGDGTFTSEPNITTSGYSTVEIADFNQHGILDLAVISGTVTVTTYKGKGDGTFTQQATISTNQIGNYVSGTALADFNGDGIPDITAVGNANGIPLFLGNGNGTFTEINPTISAFPPTLFPNGNYYSTYFSFIGAGDFNGDGLTDLIIQQLLPSYGGVPPIVGGGVLSDLLNQAGWTASATFGAATPSLGTHVITASYPGDSNYKPSNAGTVTLTTQTATITAPTSGIVLFPGNYTFAWTTGTGVTQYKLYLGTGGEGSSNLYAGEPTTATSAIVPLGSLPLNGATITATLYSYIDGTWQPVTATYYEAQPPALTSPAPGSHLSSSTVTFTWTAGSGVTEYRLNVSTYGPGYFNIYGSGVITTTSVTAPNLPTDGYKLYVTLYYLINGTWSALNYTYTAEGSTAPPVLTTPTPGSKLSSSTVTFTWTLGSGVTEYRLNISSYGPGYFNIYGSGPITTTSVTVPSLPTDGRTLYITLYYLIDYVWSSVNYTYTATGSVVPPVLTTPTPGSELSGSSVPFTWTRGSGVVGYELLVSTYGPGYFNIYGSGTITTTSVTVPGIPTNGKPVYVTLRYENAEGIWNNIYYTYTAQ